ncbi:purine-nucleoside phosphorylase [Albimonas sp. CAU 1670]|uniref:purine-nucleoside phosphorylase n=1 Tax=Albimonas sp. CAU 1670 TaxID=3032599 RepID=UPI0023DBC5FE|nr:purine-nucleoside phosphorylase [Albimonas sp. CAU 1670]MDF2235201.1 purine-nucleoside phosphorylase [Albimonas sp. CAU 1670]
MTTPQPAVPPLAPRRAAALEAVAPRIGPAPEIAMILGSGLGQLAEAVEDPSFLPYAEIPGFPVSTAPSHAGRFVIGRLFGRRAVLMQGRVHLYEGWSAQDVALPVWLMARMGAKTLVVTNAAGALNPALKPGVPMLIEDHLNLTGQNPLIGANDDALGPRFPDMSRAYAPELRELARDVAMKIGEELPAGIYAGISGPSLETSAERRWLRASGGDAVGMSTVLEVIAANHAGMKVLGLSAITNAADGGPEQQPDTIEEVLENAAHAGARIARLVEALAPDLP